MTEILTLKEEQQILKDYKKDYKEKVIKYNQLIKNKNDSEEVHQAWKEVDKIEEKIWELGYCSDCFRNWGGGGQDEKELVEKLEQIKLVPALIKWDNDNWGGDCLKHLIILARSIESQGKDNRDYYLKAVKEIWKQGIPYQIANTYIWDNDYGEIQYFQTQKVWFWVIAPEAIKEKCNKCNERFSGLEDVLELCYLPNNVVDYLEKLIDEDHKNKDSRWLLANGYEDIAGSIAENEKQEKENRNLWNKFIQESYHPECLKEVNSELFSKIEANDQLGWWSEGKNCYCLSEWTCLRDIKEKKESKEEWLKYCQNYQEIYQVQANALADKMLNIESEEEEKFFFGSKQRAFENAWKRKVEKANDYAKEIEKIQKELQKLDYLEAQHIQEGQRKEVINE